MKLQYRANNAYSYMIVFDEDRAEVYMMDGSEEWPILTDKTEAKEYLKGIALYIENLSGADNEVEREGDEPVDDFFSRICVDDDHYEELIAEIQTEGMVPNGTH